MYDQIRQVALKIHIHMQPQTEVASEPDLHVFGHRERRTTISKPIEHVEDIQTRTTFGWYVPTQQQCWYFGMSCKQSRSCGCVQQCWNYLLRSLSWKCRHKFLLVSLKSSISSEIVKILAPWQLGWAGDSMEGNMTQWWEVRQRRLDWYLGKQFNPVDISRHTTATYLRSLQ